MKHTMKKLLCMAMVIMLLVSAVPVFAAADDGFGDDLSSVFVEEDFGEDTVFSDGTTAAVNDTTTDGTTTIVSDTPDTVAEEGDVNSVKVYAKLVTANSTGTQFKTAASISNKNLKDTVSLNSVLMGASYLNQGATDSSTGISQSQLYNYKCYTDFDGKSSYDNLNNVTAFESAVDVGGTLADLANDGVVYIVFYRQRIQFDVTLELEESDYAPATIKVNAFDVLNVPNAFSSNGLKAASGSYIYMYVDTIDTNRAIGTSYRITQNCTIVGKQDLLSNKAENDKNGVGSGSTSSGSGSTSGTSSSGSTGSTGSSSGSTKFPHIFLSIYKDTTVGSPDKRIEITNGIALDNVVTLAEVKNVVKNYYTAKDDNGIQYDGLYVAGGNWADDYVNDNGKYDTIDTSNTSEGTIIVMITNAKAKTTATADTSNPKTGDTIFVPVMVMGLTASALAAAYVIGKKRFAR